MTIIYMSTDASAPVLNGTAGSLLAVLSACLVDGYGAKLAAGWTKPFTGTNKACFRQNIVDGRYVDINDTFGQYVNAIGWETMTAVETGTNRFPTSGQASVGVSFYKSNAATTAERTWVLGADDTTFWVYSNFTATDPVGGYTSAANSLLYFGALFDSHVSDTGAVVLIGGTPGTTSLFAKASALNAAASGILPAHYLAKDYLDMAVSLAAGKVAAHPNQLANVSQMGVSTTVPFPDSITGSAPIAPLWVHNIPYIPRGRLKGFWAPINIPTSLVGQTMAGTGELAGKTFLIVGLGNLSAVCVGLLEITDTWG